MVFPSFLFLHTFLPLALGLYFLAPPRARNGLLAGLSYLFYGWNHPAFVVVMLGSTLVDYFCARGLEGATGSSRKWIVAGSVCSNLGALGYFKYANFGLETVRSTLATLGWDGVGDGFLQVTLPLGISFYTFQSMSYTIDVFRGEARAIRRFLDFACYVSMFPQLVAGPIVRFREVQDQLHHRVHSVDGFARGVVEFQLGFAKKVLVANPCGLIADPLFGAESPGCLGAWVGLVAYSLQIYFDFSGYSDMAVGLGRMFGFQLPRNFFHPYRASSVTDFWRRWHQSLSRWLRDYLYIPLGGSRGGPWKTYRNLALVMLLGGLWHGASWNFVVWGAWHGTLLASERLLRGAVRVPRIIARTGTLLAVMVGWVLFRAESLSLAGEYFSQLAGVAAPGSAAPVVDAFLHRRETWLPLLIGGLLVLRGRDTIEFAKSSSPWRGMLALLLFVFAALVLTTPAHNPFLYFRF